MICSITTKIIAVKAFGQKSWSSACELVATVIISSFANSCQNEYCLRDPERWKSECCQIRTVCVCVHAHVWACVCAHALQHLSPIQLKSLFGLPGCVLPHSFGIWLHCFVLTPDEFSLVCCSLLAENYISHLCIVQHLTIIFFECHVCMCRPSVLFLLFILVFTTLRLLVKGFHSWTFTTCCSSLYVALEKLWMFNLQMRVMPGCTGSTQTGCSITRGEIIKSC